MVESNKQLVGKGAAYIYIETIVLMISGYAFWIILSKITTAEVIGTSSAVVSFAGIFSVVVSIGIPTGIQRFLGKSFSEQKIDVAKVFVKSSLMLICMGILACSIVVLIAQNFIYDLFRINFNLTIIAILITGSSAISMLFRSIVISSLKTKILSTTVIVSSASRLVLAIVLALMGTGAIGLSIGFSVQQILSCVVLGIVVVTILRPSKNGNSGTRFSHVSKKILVASAANWVPLLLTTIGSQIGTVVVFGSRGSDQAGVYFIALTLVSGIIGVMYSLFTIAIPALSAMNDARKRFAWQTIRLSAIISLPFSCSLIFYSKEIMQLLGQQYIQGSLSLEIMLLSMLPTIVLTGITSLVYAYGNYRQVLAIGLATSVTRTILYFILVPIYGGMGAAISYTIGSIMGFAASIIIAKKIRMVIFWKELILILIIPLGIGLTLRYIELNYIIGILVILVTSYAILMKLRILTYNDIVDSLKILPYNISNPVIYVLNGIHKKLNRFY